MSEIVENESNEKPASLVATIFEEPTSSDFEEDIGEEERLYYRNKYKDLNTIKNQRLHCTACDRHLGCAARNDSRMKTHPMLRTLVCHSCHTFYNSGEFEKGDDGSELYCRWCGQGGQVYCCSDCPHVFCAKCIKRNFGSPMIKEIESAEDWKCFKCVPRTLWDLRALCWALLRYCDYKNKLVYKTEDRELKSKYYKDCAMDESECCRKKKIYLKKKEFEERPVPIPISVKKENNSEVNTKKSATDSVISKIPPSIQVKKFASINNEDNNKLDKTKKRPVSPSTNPKGYLKNPLAIAGSPFSNVVRHAITPAKKPRMMNYHTIRCPQIAPKSVTPFPRMPVVKSKPLILSAQSQKNNYNYDNINLSLDSLTQGLDMASVVAMNNMNCSDGNVVCTPDFPLEPLCEVTEDLNDDDVECITPGPIAAPKISAPSVLPTLLPRPANSLPDLSPENIIQMTDNDVTVNSVTGGLKFRVDPQTLSANKMYRLPDGRIFAINANPAMPGGYSATIVAVTESANNSSQGPTFAAKISTVIAPPPLTPMGRNKASKQSSSKVRKSQNKVNTRNRFSSTSSKNSKLRVCDLKAPIEWFRFNLIDAIGSLEYPLGKLNKIKKTATSLHLRSCSVEEMQQLHKSFERLLSNSIMRFTEIRNNLALGMKDYLAQKECDDNSDDDVVEILQTADDSDTPIFIDENSTESNIETVNISQNNEVDLISDHNDSGEKDIADTSKCINESINDKEAIATDPLAVDNDSIALGEKTKSQLEDESQSTELKGCSSKSSEQEGSSFKSTELQEGRSPNSSELKQADSSKTFENSNEISTNIEASNSADLNLVSDEKIDECDPKLVNGNLEILNSNGNDENSRLKTNNDNELDELLNNKIDYDDQDKEADGVISDDMIEKLLKDDSSEEVQKMPLDSLIDSTTILGT